LEMLVWVGVVAGICCFMIVRNALSQGYPFVEAIAQALPVCDKFLVSDGGSSDGTLEVLRRIEGVNSKVRVYVDPWPGRGFAYDLRWATNTLLRRCDCSYVFYIQANEVIHEDSWDYIRELPEMWPRAITFSLPFLLVYGTIRFHEQYRLRMAKNLPYIEAIYDAWALGLKKSFIALELLKSILKPAHLARIVYKGVHRIYADTGGIPVYTVHAIPPKPVYRYQAVLPGDPVMKQLERAKTWGTKRDIEEAEKKLEWLRKTECTRETLEAIVEEARKSMEARGHQVPRYPEKLREVRVEEHPKIMRELLQDKNTCHYYVREELYQLIKDLK